MTIYLSSTCHALQSTCLQPAMHNNLAVFKDHCLDFLVRSTVFSLCQFVQICIWIYFCHCFSPNMSLYNTCNQCMNFCTLVMLLVMAFRYYLKSASFTGNFCHMFLKSVSFGTFVKILFGGGGRCHHFVQSFVVDRAQSTN